MSVIAAADPMPLFAICRAATIRVMTESKVDGVHPARTIAGLDRISDDRRCMSCGYQLRGLRIGDPCPECGQRAGRDRSSGLNEVPVRILLRLRKALSLTLLAWNTGIALWFWCYYGVLRSAGPVLAGCLLALVAPAVVIMTSAWNEIEDPPFALWRSITSMMRFVLAAASIVLGLLLFVRSPLAPATASNVVLPMVSITALAWVGLQALSCLFFRRIAAAGHDGDLSDRYWNLACVLGGCIAFISPYLAMMQTVQNRSGMVPICCLGGYLVIVGFFGAQIVFAVSTFRLRSIVRWAIRYRDQYENKSAEMAARIQAARSAGGAQTTALIRD